MTFKTSRKVRNSENLGYCRKLHSIHPSLQRRVLYEALSLGFCACSGVIKNTFYYVQKPGKAHNTSDRHTPSDTQAHSPGQHRLLWVKWVPSFGLCSGHSGTVFPTSLFVWMGNFLTDKQKYKGHVEI